MKPTLYEALGLSRTATEVEVKGALRRLVRRYYTKTRSGDADVEEALRFLNHASHILGNPAHRAEYDANLAETARAATAATTISGTFLADFVLPGDTGPGESISPLELPRDRPTPPPELAPELWSQLADIRRTRAGQLTALVSVAALLVVAWIVSVPKGGAASLVSFTLSVIVVTGFVAAIALGMVHLLSRSIWRLPAPENALTLVEGMIPRWRKDRTVFLGTGAPVEDATWLFRLRMAELKRVKSERVSDPYPWMRLFARIFDYALWGLAYAAIIAVPALLGLVPAGVATIAFHPLVAPIVVTFTWIPIEALLLAHLQTTPGRWLLCVYLQNGVSNPYAPEELRFTFRAAIARALDVWWRGCAAWLPVISLVTMARARELVKRSGETRWDSQRDCLVTHGPVGAMNFCTLGLGLLACVVVYAAQWRQPIQAFTASASHAMAAITPKREATIVQAPIISPHQARISRLDDVTPGTPAASGTAEASGAAGAGESAAAAAGTSQTANAGSSATGPAVAPLNEPPLAPMVASKRAMAIENEKPAAVNRIGDEGGASSSAPISAVPAPTSAPPATKAAPPAANAPPASSTPGQSETAQSDAASSTTPSPASAFSPKTFFANLFKKSQPAEPAAAPPMIEEPRAPTATELRERRVGDFMRQAQRQQSAGDYAGLIRTCTRWTDDDYKNPRAFFCLGIGLQGTGQHKQAIAIFNKAGSLLPRDDPLKQQISDAVIRSFRAQTGG